MSDLRWSWLATPYIACAALILAATVATALLRGDRVLRLGVVGATMSALPWAIGQATAACTDDPAVAWRVLRLGQGPIALVGPNLMLVLLGVSGQLERYRWVARIAAVIGGGFLVACWMTDWIVPGVQRLPAGTFYMSPGPLTGMHVLLLVGWLVVGLVIARRAAPIGDRKRTLRLVLGVLVFAAIGSIDALLLYGIWGVYPIAWLPASIAAAITIYLVVRTDFLRPQGFDRAIAVELALAMVAFGVLAALAYLDGPSAAVLAGGAIVWASLTGVAWTLVRSRPVRVTGERELEQFVARVATLDDETRIAERLATLWRGAIGIELRTLWWRDGDTLTSAAGTRWTLDPVVEAWLVRNSQALALSDLATMRLGPIRAKIEALAAAHGAGLVVPLVDREQLVGLVEADYKQVLRDSVRALVGESARAAARALTFASLSRIAARERDTAREVEVADAMRLQASASREAELGRWVVAAEYRTAPRTTGAGWSAIELADGRLALLVTEAQAHGVAAALATAALTGAFAAATAGSVQVTLKDLITALRASSEGVLRSGEPVAAFLAIVDARTGAIDFACAGHPGAFLVGPIAALDGGVALGSGKGARPEATPIGAGTREPDASLGGATRHRAAFPPDTLLVVASTALRGDDDARWQAQLRETAPAGGRLASVLVDIAARHGTPDEDLLAVIVRAR